MERILLTNSPTRKQPKNLGFSCRKMSEKCVNNAAFLNIQDLFSERVTICFAVKHTHKVMK